VSFDGRLASIERQLADFSRDPAAEISTLPFWSRLSDALSSDDFAELLRDWELPRRLALLLAEAERGGDTILSAYAARWREILWGGQAPTHLAPVELLEDIRARLRTVLS
jgi:hypothetical protein